MGYPGLRRPPALRNVSLGGRHDAALRQGGARWMRPESHTGRSVRQRCAEPDDGERSDENRALKHMCLRAADVPADEPCHENDQRELHLKDAAVPLVEVRGEWDACRDQDRDRDEGSPAEATRDRAQPLPVRVSPKGRHDRGREEVCPPTKNAIASRWR